MDHEELVDVLACAQLAPSINNTQPWTFALVGEVIEVRADRSRQLAVEDPAGRQLTLSCGAAIEFAYLAVRNFGHACAVALHPAPDDHDLLAALTLGAAQPPTARERALLDALPRRYTDRGLYDAGTLSPDLYDELSKGVADRGAWLRQMDHDGDRGVVIRALAAAEEAEASDPEYRQELTSWVRLASAPDGIPLAATGSPAGDVVTDVPRRDFSGRNTHPHPGDRPVPPSVARDVLLMIGTASDDRQSWLQAGRALGWLLLRLTEAGLSAQPLGQALDVETSRQRLAGELGLIGHIQFLLRTGVGHGVPATGRRLVPVPA